jgi:hypothetical protein
MIPIREQAKEWPKRHPLWQIEATRFGCWLASAVAEKSDPKGTGLPWNDYGGLPSQVLACSAKRWRPFGSKRLPSTGRS